jgi:hypothetical protein
MVDAVLPLLYRGVTGGFGATTLSGSQCPSSLEAALLLSRSGKLERVRCTARLSGLSCFIAATRLMEPPAQVLAGVHALHLLGRLMDGTTSQQQLLLGLANPWRQSGTAL